VPQPEPIVLYEAAKAGKLDEVEAAVDAGAQVEWANPDNYGARAVHIASRQGHKDVVAFLGSRGADVNAVDGTQFTPLHFAAFNGHASVCTTLLALGADPAAKNNVGKTALDKARQARKTECVAVLEAAIPASTTVSVLFLFLLAACSYLARLQGREADRGGKLCLCHSLAQNLTAVSPASFLSSNTHICCPPHLYPE
jgi:ankyrin repeat protein